MNREDQERLDRIHELPCVACEIYHADMSGGRVEAHHLVDKGNREASGGHQATIPLCAWHHRGEPPRLDLRPSQCFSLFGPSLARSKRAFYLRFGDERELLQRTNRMLMVMRSGGSGASATQTD